MASKSQRPTSPVVRNAGLMPLQRQTSVSPVVAKHRIENRALPSRVYDPKKAPRSQPTSGHFAAPIQTAAAGGFGSNTVAGAQSIAELARALKNDVDLIYKFVYDNIEFIPTYGSQKGALGCLIDGMGNAFDQAELMIELLREAGYTASYQLGDLEMLEADAAAIFGTDTNIWAISNLLAVGGIPNSTYWNWPNWYIRFTHCWVKVTISGTDYVFDPALKAYTAIAGMNMDTALSFSTSTFMSNATSGATVTSDYVQNLNRSNIRGDLDDFTDNLIDYIKTNKPDATTDDVIGGRTINPQSGTVRNTAHPSLQSGTSVTTWTTDIPNAYKATLNIYYWDATTPIDETFYSKDIHGKRLTLFFNGSHEAELRLDGTLIATSGAQGVGTYSSVWLEVVHPYPTTFADEGHWQTVWADKPYLIAQAWGNASRGMIEEHRTKARQNEFDGSSTTSEAVLGESLAQFWHTWNTKKSWACDVFNRMTDCKTVLHHQTGLVGHYDTMLTDLGGIVWASGALDNDWDNVDTNDTALAMHGISFEEGIMNEILDLDGVSSTPLLDIANSNGDKIYDASSSNWTGTVEPALTNYNSTDKSNIKSWWIDAGWRVALPEDGALSKGDWDGFGYFAISPYYGAIGIIQGGLKGSMAAYALSSNQIFPRAACQLPDYGYLTLGSCSYRTTGMSNGWGSASSGSGIIRPSMKHGFSWEPVVLRSGAYIYDHVDLTVGSASFPYGLSFQRFYSSTSRLDQNVLGLGWTHNHRITASANSDPFMGMGMTSPILGAAGLVEMYVSVALLRDLTKPLDKWVTAVIANKWLNDQLKENTVIVSLAEGSKSYLKQPDGTYVPTDGDGSSLALSSGAYSMTTAHGVEYNFNTDGDISTIVFPAGPTITYTYTSGKLSSVTNGMGRTLSFTYTGDKLTGVSDGNGRSVSFAYDVDDNLETATDAEGEDTTFEYDDPGRMTKIFKPANPTLPIVINTYDTLGRVKEQKDAYNNITKFYIAGPRSEEEDPNNESRIVEFGRQGEIIRATDKLGNVITYEYDGIGRVIKVTAPEGNSTEYEYDADNNVVTVTAKAKPGSGLSDIVNKFTYDTTWKKKVKTAEDGLGNVVTYTYNSTTGTLTKIEFPVISSQTPTVQFTYNGRGQVLTKEDPTGIITEFTYDSTTEKLTQVVHDKGTGRKNITTQFTYDTVGNVTAVQNPNGDSTAFEYDDLRRLTKSTAPSPLSYQTKFTYDENGNRTKVERETGDISNPWQTSTATYAIDDLLLSVTDPGSQTTSFDYTALRQLWKTTDAASRVTTRAYDENGRILTVTDNASVVQVTNTYTDNGLLETVEDGEGNETEYQYDGFDRLKKKIYPNTKYEELSYDANSRVTKIRTRNADEIDFSYDVLGRLIQKAPDGMPTVSFEYDLAGRRTKVSTAVVSGNPASGDFEYYYDTAGRLTKEEWPDNKSVQYQYDDNGNVTRVTYPDSYYVERVFDEINRLTGIKLNGATALALEFEYDKLSRRTKLTYENGVETDYGFQLDNDMESLIQTFTGSSVEFSYGFNSVHELTSQSVDDSAYMWHPASGGTVTYGSANSMNQYPTVAGNSISYDDNGCLTDDGTFAFAYDTENQLIEADDGSTVSTYIYDPMRRQNQKDVGGTKTRYLYDGLQMIAEYDGSGTLQKKYVYGTGLDEVLIELDSSNNKTYLHHDRKGSIIATSNSSGAVINSYAYSPFGESGSLSGTTFGYTGQRFDPEAGLYYFKNRHYSPELGRFLQPDLIGYGDGLNVYQYGYNDPNMFSDPLGLAADGSRLSSDAGGIANNSIGALVAGGVAGAGGWYAFGTYVLAGSQNFGQNFAFGETYAQAPQIAAAPGSAGSRYVDLRYVLYYLPEYGVYHSDILATKDNGNTTLIGFWPITDNIISVFITEDIPLHSLKTMIEAGLTNHGLYKDKKHPGQISSAITLGTAKDPDDFMAKALTYARAQKNLYYNSFPILFAVTSNQLTGLTIENAGGVLPLFNTVNGKFVAYLDGTTLYN